MEDLAASLWRHNRPYSGSLECWAESVTFYFPLSPEHPLLTWMPVQGRKLLGAPSLSGEGSGSSPWDASRMLSCGPRAGTCVDTDPGSVSALLSASLLSRLW